MFKIQFKHKSCRSIWLVGERIKLGVDKSNDLVLTGIGITDFHAEIIIETNNLVLRSKAGSCYVNGLPVDAEHKLAANDELRIGNEHMLIVDPKVDFVPTANTTPIEPVAEDSSSWALIPDHSLLKQRDFTVKQQGIIGRSKECAFYVPYKLLSMEHALLRVENGELWFEDLDSANGCFINGVRVQQARLFDGDQVAFAKLVFTVQHTSINIAALSEKTLPQSDALKEPDAMPANNIELVLQRAEEQRRQTLLTTEKTAVVGPDSELASRRSKKGLWAGMVVILLAIAIGLAVVLYTSSAEFNRVLDVFR